MEYLLEGIAAVTWQQLLMIVIGAVLIILAIKKDLEPALLLPMGFGAILVNLPLSGAIDQLIGGAVESHGIIQWLFEVGIEASEALPLLLFIGIGAMIDFGPILANPKLMFFGAAAQVGIFLTIILAQFISDVSPLDFAISDAASIGMIGAADGPTSILVSQVLGSKYVGAIAVAAYSYMALVPIIQPIVMKACTTKKERMIRMEYNPSSVSQTTKVIFPILVTVITGFIAPASVSLVGFLMFGNLLRECGVLKTLTDTASNSLSNLITLLLGITISFSMKAENFVKWDTLMIMGLGLAAFVFDTFGGIMLAKIVNLFTKKKINPLIGAAGISAFPMASRVVQKVGLEADPTNHLLMQAAGANVAGQIASVIAGGVILGLVPGMM
jgi:oxaloacetate decarboxylase beta subunit